MHQMQRNPKLAWTLAMGSIFVLALLICLGLATFMYTTLDKNSNSIVPEQSLFVLDIKRAAEIIFRDRVVVSMNHVLLPLRGIEDKNALEIPDFGELEMDFLENDSSKRTIHHDYALDLTEFRPADAKADDEMNDA